MASIAAQVSQVISQPADLVRRHFLDMEHHQRHPVHAGARFEVIEQSASHSEYIQRTRLGPFMLRERARLDRDGDAVVNRSLDGANEGMTVKFQFRPLGPERTEVVASVEMPKTGVRRLLAPVLRRMLESGFRKALEEDRVDLEERGYPRS